MDGRLSTSIGEVQAKTVSPRNLNLDPQMDFFDPNKKFEIWSGNCNTRSIEANYFNRASNNVNCINRFVSLNCIFLLLCFVGKMNEFILSSHKKPRMGHRIISDIILFVTLQPIARLFAPFEMTNQTVNPHFSRA